MTTRTLILHRIALTAPWLTMALLIVLPLALPNRTSAQPEAEARKLEVARAMAAAAVMIPSGGWVGANENIPPEAQKLLKPNAILSRKYRRIGSPPVHVFIVHCADARDMIGHYPPVCYPSAGWLPMETPEIPVSLPITRGPFPVREYGYRQMRDRNEEIAIRIFNAFILPDGVVTPDINDITTQSERLAVTTQGVAQLQVITPASMSRTDAIDVAAELLNGLDPLLETLRVGTGRSAQASAALYETARATAD